MTALMTDNRTYTQNMAPALFSTGSATLDAFNKLNSWSFNDVSDYLEKAWKEDPVVTLRLIWNIRSIHDGKSEKELFYRAFGWLYDNHPRTALSNLHMIVAPSCTTPKDKDKARPHGYWKDLLHILALATCDQLSNLTAKSTFLHNYTPSRHSRYSRRSKAPKPRKKPEEIKEFEERMRLRAKEKRKELYRQFHVRLTRKLENDPKYRALYIMIARMFAERLRKDVAIMDELKKVDIKVHKRRWYELSKSISLAGKWAPTPSGAHDRVTNISTAICSLLFSPNENFGPGAIGPLPSTASYPIPDNAENCSILRSYYGHWILRPLREVICCPEPLMSASRWTEIRYGRVPSVCMSTNKARFIEHDPEGFSQFMVDVEKGKRKISGATLMPHELVGEAMRLRSEIEKARRDTKLPLVAEYKKNIAEQEIKVVDAQWRTLVERLKESGTLDNSIAICDVSGSMGSVRSLNKKNVSPIFPAVGLSLILAHLSKPPFDSGFITFSATPQFVRLENMEKAGLANLVHTMSHANWDMNTDFQAVFLKLLLPLATTHKVAKEDMIKRIFVFSDMQFDEAQQRKDTNKWETNHEKVEQAYAKAGYEVPEIVYWNLTGKDTYGRTVEVQAEKKGVAMMSGFSASMMKVFMMGEEEEEGEGWAEVMKDGKVVEDKEDEMTPLNVMKKALFKKSFDGLVVLD
ncbi:hypothetical protein AGABI2DRAFT_185657 [Agaricus bisporus var. bisporus H97]|uniref:hypothetical protein n=1 Tax=Agaricus bisporus var. bisporus (strain H97 / ATCC MYA-4626 / FGSC 10389) TaxID=936046 RepID=UPI00029F7DB6|nr:hypothetical protein AGABI2DRAFT_185657 [Agaricus bisporus var. bisporus H97]EKV47756.1 hypothetical protein AGABI2DRAFT_185657 [Agaricus bisporus var. bisporus H97]